MAIRSMNAGAANAASEKYPSMMPAAPAPGGRYQISEAHRKECSMFMTDFWTLIKLTFERENTDQYWSELVRLSDSLGRKYYGNLFAYSMIMQMQSADLVYTIVTDQPGFVRCRLSRGITGCLEKTGNVWI